MNVTGKILIAVSIVLVFLTLLFSGSFSQNAEAQSADTLRILQVTGGGPWHDYGTQKDQIENGLLERLSNIEITTDYEGADTLTMESTSSSPDTWRKTGPPILTSSSTTNATSRLRTATT